MPTRGGAERTIPEPDPPEPNTDYAARLRELAWLDIDETEAEALWLNAERHRRYLGRRLGRDVGQTVALLDYILNIRRRLAEPQIIERTALETLEYQAIVDAVTGLYNRRFFETELAHEVERCRRYGGWLSLLLIDLDQFKKINDRHGHAVGDRILQQVGVLSRLHVRAVDIPCRYGGDEFAVILPDAPPADAQFVAERVRGAVEASFRQAVGGMRFEVTASGGLASQMGEAADPDILFRAADAALYRAKEAGGNRVAEAERDTGTKSDTSV
ncbi:MAG: GGDEF domain-containing protein [Gemmatimonadales bacterium]